MKPNKTNGRKDEPNIVFTQVMVYGVSSHLQQYFSYIVVVSFIVGGIQRKPPTCCK
jgi:hypothetical protein